MLKEEFEMWPADLFPNTTLITIGIYVINFGYLEDGPPCLMKFPDGDTKELNKMLVGLDTTAIIPKTNDQELLDLINSKAE